jgi:tRNA 2-thiouridine synthesizing protein A
MRGVDSVGSDENEILVKHILDARGLQCPLPLLKAKQHLNKMNKGEYLKVLATDSGSMRDVQSFSKLSDHHLLSMIECDGVYEYILLKG